jgi:hypothetical protein
MGIGIGMGIGISIGLGIEGRRIGDFGRASRTNCSPP